MTYYLDYDTGRLYLSAARSQLVDTLSAKYGDTITLRLVVLDASGQPRDIGTDVLRLGVRIGGTQALLVDGARYTPTVSGAVVSPSYEMDVPVNTTPIKDSLVNRDYVHLTAELERETMTGLHVSSQTITLHVEPDIVDINDVPDVAPGIPAATEAWVLQLAEGITAGTIPGFEVASTTMLPPGSPATTTLTRDAGTGLYKFAFLLPATPGERGIDGASAYAIAKSHGYVGTEAQWLESLKGAYVAKGATYRPSTSVNGATLTLSWSNDGGLSNPSPQQIVIPPGAKGDKGDTGAQGIPGTTGAQGERGAQGDTGIIPPLQMGEVRESATADAWFTYDETAGYTLYLDVPRGSSAYEVAVANGYEGSEPQWLDSLQGPKGDAGASGSGDVSSAANNIFTGHNTFAGKVTICHPDRYNGPTITPVQSTEEALDGPPTYYKVSVGDAASFLDFYVTEGGYDTPANGGSQDEIRLISSEFSVNASNKFGIVNIGRLLAWALPRPTTEGSYGYVLTKTGPNPLDVGWRPPGSGGGGGVDQTGIVYLHPMMVGEGWDSFLAHSFDPGTYEIELSMGDGISSGDANNLFIEASMGSNGDVKFYHGMGFTGLSDDKIAIMGGGPVGCYEHPGGYKSGPVYGCGAYVRLIVQFEESWTPSRVLADCCGGSAKFSAMVTRLANLIPAE